MQTARAIVENEFEHGFLAAMKAFDAEGYNFSASDSWFAELKIIDRQKVSTIFVTARAMQEQIGNAPNSEARQLTGPFRTNTPKRRHRAGKW
jgi:hypothetical protein